MKITRLPLSISVLGLFAALSSAQAKESIVNCAQLGASSGQGSVVEPSEFCAKTIIPFDFGDAPAPYPSSKEANGARHELGTDVYLGTCVDSDSGSEAVGDLEASLDDNNAATPVYGTCTDDDDEDGVTFSRIVLGQKDIPVQIVANKACKLNAWIDWNADKDWNDTGEQVFKDVDLVEGNNEVFLDVPKFAAVSSTFARFRCSTAGGDKIVGDALDGEVEDYKIRIEASDAKPPLSVGNLVWLDADRNGQQNKGEYGVAGTELTLLKADGTRARDLNNVLVPIQIVAAEGDYLFTNLPAGEYIVRVKPPAAYSSTEGGIDPDKDASDTDSNCTIVNGHIQTPAFTLSEQTTINNTNPSVDCGLYQLHHSIGNQVWIDNGGGVLANANNGLLDSGEPAVSDGVRIELLGKAGNLISSTTTQNGFYLFSPLVQGEYKVCIAASNFNSGGLLAGYTASTGGDETDANLDGDNNDNGGALDAKGICSGWLTLGVDEPLNESPTASGVAGDDGYGSLDAHANLTVDFALLPPSTPVATPLTLGDKVWVDLNADGIQDEVEPGLSGASVRLTTASGGTVNDLDGKPVGVQVTSDTGLYRFTNLPEGDYIVTVQPPSGYYLTEGGLDVDGSNDNTDSNCIAASGSSAKTHPVTLSIEAEPSSSVDGDDENSNLTADCGFYRSVSVGDTIWDDLNADGQQDVNEPGLSGVTVELTEADGLTPVLDYNGDVIPAVTTDSSGSYRFDNLKPGTYTVVVKPQIGYQVSPGGNDPDTDTSATDSNCVAQDGIYRTPSFDLRVDGDVSHFHNPDVDCGFYRSVTLGDFVWIDRDADGRQDSGEPGLAGATVRLMDSNGQAAKDLFGNTVPAVITDQNGKYRFNHLAEGDYVVSVTVPMGFTPTLAVADANSDNDTDSNGVVRLDELSVKSQSIKLEWGKEPSFEDDDSSSNLTVDFGFVPSAGVQIPTLSQWGMIFLSFLMAIVALFRRREH